MPPPPGNLPETLGTRDGFLARYRIRLADYRKTGLAWRVLQAIYADYRSWHHELTPIANQLGETLRLAPKVVAFRSRVKDPEHLIEKIIRDSFENGRPSATPRNYRVAVKDLIGARALHLFKEDWPIVHAYVRQHWRRYLGGRRPRAKITSDDPGHIRSMYARFRCNVRLDKHGYRSVHYVLRLPFQNRSVFAEIQVRTLFEEAYGEISHALVYPYKKGNRKLVALSQAVSYAAGTADAWASILNTFGDWTDLPRPNSARAREQRTRLADEFELKAEYGGKMSRAFRDKVRLNRKEGDTDRALARDMLGIEPRPIRQRARS